MVVLRLCCNTQGGKILEFCVNAKSRRRPTSSLPTSSMRLAIASKDGCFIDPFLYADVSHTLLKSLTVLVFPFRIDLRYRRQPFFSRWTEGPQAVVQCTDSRVSLKMPRFLNSVIALMLIAIWEPEPTLATAMQTSSNPNAILPGWTRLGCFVDQGGIRVLSKASFTSPTMTPAACMNLCTLGNYGFAGVEFHDACISNYTQA